MSGYTDKSIVHHGIIEPDVAYIQKPLIPEVLRGVCARYSTIRPGVGHAGVGRPRREPCPPAGHA